jgi:hypothetical protein
MHARETRAAGRSVPVLAADQSIACGDNLCNDTRDWETLKAKRMSRGLGRVSAVVLAAFRRKSIWKTSELCRLVYKTDRIEKKHRVAVLRALRTLLVRREVKIRRFRPTGERVELEWFDEQRFGRPTHSSAVDPPKSLIGRRRR